jgi:hypothetical protein
VLLVGMEEVWPVPKCRLQPPFFDAKATVAAGSQKPSYAVIAQQDRMINPDLERFMSSRATLAG